jgi:hypothetical protein
MYPLAIAVVVAGALVFFLRWLINNFVRARADKVVAKILKNPNQPHSRALENPKYGTLVAKDTGFEIVNPGGSGEEVLWNEIEEVHAFKRDLITTDMICLEFKRSGKEQYYEVNEEMAGYQDLLQAMQKYLPGFNLSWIPGTTLPPFATNHQTIWKRSVLTAR